MIIRVPNDLKSRYVLSKVNFIRDMACVAMLAISPFFKGKIDYTKIVSTRNRNGFDDISKKIRPEFHITNPDCARYMHFDLSENRDTVGFAMCHTPNFVERYKLVPVEGTKRYEPQILKVPNIVFDLIGRVEVSKREELDYNLILDIIFLSTERRANIHLITFDRFQSSTLRRMLIEHGYVTANLSVDRTAFKIMLSNDPKLLEKSGLPIKRVTTEQNYSSAMQSLKDAIDEDRCEVCYDQIVQEGQLIRDEDAANGRFIKRYLKFELEGAEYDGKKDKVDHSKRSTIDMLQGMAGACFNCVNNSYDNENVWAGRDNSQSVDTFMADQDEFQTLRSQSGVDNFYNEYGDSGHASSREVYGL